jgi:hypothetical protein
MSQGKVVIGSEHRDGDRWAREPSLKPVIELKRRRRDWSVSFATHVLALAIGYALGFLVWS